MPTTSNPLPKYDPISVRPNKIMVDQLTDLAAGGFGDNSEIIRRAVDRMWREEVPAIDARQVKEENSRLRAEIANLIAATAETAPARLEVWIHRDSGDKYGVMTAEGVPVVALGPISRDVMTALLTKPGTASELDGWNQDTGASLFVYSDEYDRVR